MRRSFATLAAAWLLTLALTAQGEVVVELSVAPATSLAATLESMDQDVVPAEPSGALFVRLVLTEHPVHGLVAQSVEIVPGSLSIGDLAWFVSGAYETLTASLGGGTASAVSSPIPASPTGANTAEVPTDDLTLELMGGELSASGTVVDHGIDVTRDLSLDPWPIELGSVATIVTTPLPAGAVAIELRIPVSQAVPIDPPFLVSWLTLDGELVLSGTRPSPVPATPHPLWVGVALLLAALVVQRLRSFAR